MDNEAKLASLNVGNGIIDDTIRKSVRHFSGRIAHDFNNLLTIQLAYPEILRQYIPEGSKGIGFLKVMEENAELMVSISRRLAHFSLPSDYAKQAISIDDTVREILFGFSDDDLSQGITINNELDSGCDVLIAHDVFCRIIREICANSFESMNGSGTLTIKTSVMNVDKLMTANDCIVPQGKYVSVSVCDSGDGIDADIREKVFEPFFTTSKQTKARGAGMGLSIAFAAVRDCGGFILLGDEGEDCVVSVIIPVAATDIDSSAEVLPDTNEDVDVERVLVVDDEEEITKLFKIMLTSAIKNIRVDIAHNGAQAIEEFKKHNHAVVVLDLHMPVIDGQEAFGKLKSLCSDKGIKMPGVVFCTGYVPPEGIMQEVSGHSEHALLKKPVSLKILSDAVKVRLPA